MSTGKPEQNQQSSATISLGDISVKQDSLLALQEQHYKITPSQAEFFKAQTGITDDKELKQHIFEVQEAAYKVAPYPCIVGFVFLHCQLAQVQGYNDILSIGRTRPDAIFLDIGCFLGTDIRKVVVDGFPANRVIGSDLHPEFGGLGHKLFGTTPDTFPGHFIPGDATDLAMLSVVPAFETAPDSPEPDLSSLTSLNPLHGRASAIHASNFFHLFSEAKQVHLARAFAGLLSPKAGSIICGGSFGLQEKGVKKDGALGSEFDMFCHSPQSWIELWDGVAFRKGLVEVDTSLTEEEVGGFKFWYLRWCVKRL
ncbi:hypothetical protein PAXRUDRAFT_833842 [Paxillus rubicundulus Ve08.2h10]|uniref:Methyltransferase ausD n=1 Tax=Paxillus rubicundulus Ve08.2h10 TaxID=930991 RepID=A0A0D0CAT1_9AGAM|nr:hypothetical protein PAXRUDRAFT_833842 [Paxillus rubicundulus Ve08.2h10]